MTFDFTLFIVLFIDNNIQFRFITFLLYMTFYRNEAQVTFIRHELARINHVYYEIGL